MRLFLVRASGPRMACGYQSLSALKCDPWARRCTGFIFGMRAPSTCTACFRNAWMASTVPHPSRPIAGGSRDLQNRTAIQNTSVCGMLSNQTHPRGGFLGTLTTDRPQIFHSIPPARISSQPTTMVSTYGISSQEPHSRSQRGTQSTSTLLLSPRMAATSCQPLTMVPRRSGFPRVGDTSIP